MCVLLCSENGAAVLELDAWYLPEYDTNRQTHTHTHQQRLLRFGASVAVSAKTAVEVPLKK